MPARAGDAATTERSSGRAASFRRASAELVSAAAGRLFERGRREYASQAAFLAALRRELVRGDPRARVGARRLRRLLLEADLVGLRVAYSERSDRRPLTACPVCGTALGPVVNRTLDDDRVVLGYRCRRCGYWTHLHRRVPTRYTVRLRRAPREISTRTSG